VAFAQARAAVETILGKSVRFNSRWIPRCVHTDPPVASTGWTEKEAKAAEHTIEVLEETIRLVTDDDRSVVDPEPIKIRLVIQPETTTLLGCQAVGAKAAEIVDLAAAALSTGLSVTQLADWRWFIQAPRRRLFGVCRVVSIDTRDQRRRLRICARSNR
jgi:dihydrolipoamide dehydrogenase